MPRKERSPYHEKLYKLTPKSARGLLGNDRYWTVDFLEVFLDHIDRVRLDDPQSACLLAEVACRLVYQIPNDLERRGFGSARASRTWRTYVLAVAGSAYRTAGNYGRASELLDEAEKRAANIRELPDWLEAQLLLRRATFFAEIDRSRSRTLLGTALSKLEGIKGRRRRQGLADGFILRGVLSALDGESALGDFVQASTIADRTTARGAASFDAACFNILRLQADQPHSLADQLAALTALRKLRSSMSRSIRYRQVLVRWAIARLEFHTGHRLASIKELMFLRPRLRELSTESEWLLISLDLAIAHTFAEDTEAARIVLKETRVELADTHGEELLARVVLRPSPPLLQEARDAWVQHLALLQQKSRRQSRS